MATSPKDSAAAMVESYLELNATIEILHADVSHSSERLNEEGTQFWRRAIVRAIFAQVEGVIYCMKRIAFSCRFQSGVSFSVGDLMILIEKTYRPDDKGKAEEQRMQISLKNNIKFAFKAYARVHMTEYELNIGDSRWDDFKKSLSVRDRLMHPKRAQDLEVSDEELNRLQRAHDWFTAATLDVMNSSLENMTKDVKSKLTAEQSEHLDRVLDSIE